MMVGFDEIRIGIVGLGYVGLPLAIEFAKRYPVVGFDIDAERIAGLKQGFDSTQEITSAELQAVNQTQSLLFTASSAEMAACTVFIITVPTPLTSFHRPDLSPLLSASKTVAKLLKKGDVVIYESTTYPGCTEEDCVPVLERKSALRYNVDFFVGYSPERINPGDKINTLTRIIKVTSGSTPETANFVDNLYGSIISAGTHKAPSIRVAEASKIIENCQRDVNISFMNELALIFDRMGIDTNDVLAASGTKWNFLNFKPGLVGGHCISVDPYYLVSKAESLGYIPTLLLAGRKTNNAIAPFIAKKVFKLMIEKGISLADAKVLILGITFKENCPDIRNTKVAEIYHEFKDFGLTVDLYDPWADAAEVARQYAITLLPSAPKLCDYKAIVLAVAHQQFEVLDFNGLKNMGHVIFDTKGMIDRDLVDGRL